MRLVHFSDLHLGFHRYQRSTANGMNQREADVAQAFTRAIDMTIALAPNLVLVAGDIFHRVRPPNQAILKAYREFARLTESLPETKVVMIAGNHDTPRSSDTVSILTLFSPLGIRVVHRGPEWVPLPELDAGVLAVPGIPQMAKPMLAPGSATRWNILLLHGVLPELQGPGDEIEDRALNVYTRSEILSDAWQYIALGDYHVYQQVGPNAYYSGSIEYTSLNPWADVREEAKRKLPGKRIIEHDLATGRHKAHSIAAARPMVDLPRIDGRGMAAPSLNTAIAETVARSRTPIDNAIVRLVVDNVPNHVERELDHAARREYGKRALHFQLDLRRPDAIRLTTSRSGSPGRRPTLADLVRDRLQARPLEADVDRGALVELGLRYLVQSEDAVVPAGLDEGES